MRTFLKWLYGTIFFLAAVFFLSTSIVGSLLFLVAALVFFPPSMEMIDKKANGPYGTKSKLFTVCFCAIVGTIFFISASGSKGFKERKEAEKREQLAISKMPKEKQDSIRLVKAATERSKKIERLFSPFDGSHNKLERYIKKYMKDPESYEHIETTYMDKQDHVLVFTKFRGKNSIGALVINEVTATTDSDGNVIEVLSQK